MATPKLRYPLRSRSSSSTRSRWSTTICRRSTTTTSGADARRRTSRTGRAVALLAGDALLGHALGLALSYDRPEPARELAAATLGMIGGQFLDITQADVALEDVHSLKTGRLFAAAIGLGLWVADVPESEQAPWRSFAEELGLLFQAVDDVIDGDGFASELGEEGARGVAAAAARRAHERLAAIDADTSVLGELVDELVVRTA